MSEHDEDEDNPLVYGMPMRSSALNAVLQAFKHECITLGMQKARLDFDHPWVKKQSSKCAVMLDYLIERVGKS